jgi:hypothetical protein
MTEDLLVVVGVLIAAAVCGWYVVQSISGIVNTIPADQVCEAAGRCVPIALGY